MAKTVHLRFTGQSERFLEEMQRQGLSAEDTIAKALGVLQLVWTTKRVALIRKDRVRAVDANDAEYFLGIQVHQASDISAPRPAEVDAADRPAKNADSEGAKTETQAAAAGSAVASINEDTTVTTNASHEDGATGTADATYADFYTEESQDKNEI